MRKRLMIALTPVFLGTALPIFADPVRVSSGRLIGSDSSVTDFRLVLPSVTVTGLVTGPGGPHVQCDACLPGTPVSLSTTLDAFEGVAFDDVPRSVGGQFVFTSDEVALPAFGGNGRAQIVRPFAFNGLVRDLQTSQTLTLIGRGWATLSLVPNDDSATWNATSIDYEFAAPAAVPEPATLLLVGLGLGAAVRRCRTSR